MKTINQLWKGWMVLCLLCLAACSDQDMDLGSGSGQPGERGIWLTFQQPGEEDADGGNAARSTLQSSEVSYKDVKEVYLYVFEGTDANAECTVKSTVNWNENKDENGQITKKVWVTADLEVGRTYTFMAVGWDDRAGATYGFPDAIVAKTGNTPGTGTKLGDCLAKLQDGKGQDDMAHSQLFVGTTTKTVASSAEDVAVTLSRKMAGILVYLRNIPVSVTYKETRCTVKNLEVRLHRNQHTSLALWNSGQPVFGTGELAESDVLFNLDLTTEESGFKPDENGRYFTKEGNDSVLADSYLAGAYLLPMDKTQTKSTISVNLRGEYTDGGGHTTQDVILKSYVVRYKNAPEDPKPSSGSQTTTYTEDYPLEENKLYAIGKKLSNSTTVNDEPADLSGNLLELTVVPWRKLGSTHTFPTVTGPARIEADYNDEVYVRDALDDTLRFSIKPAVDKNPDIKKQWTLTVNYGDGLTSPDDLHGNKQFGELPKDWIHFIAYDKEGKFLEYTDTLTGYDEQEVIAIVNHYAVERPLKYNWWYDSEELQKFKNDIRRAVIELTTQDVNEPYPLLVQQYNTLTIKTSDEYMNPRGIARLDYGCTFNKQTGEMTGRDNSKIFWGYFQTGNVSVSGDNPMNYTDGEITSDKCYNRWKEEEPGWKGYKYSGIEKLTRRFVQIETVYDQNGNKLRIEDKNPANDNDHAKEKDWYMPAYYEMWGVARTIYERMNSDTQEIEELMNMKKEDEYWTSSGDDGLIWDAYITRIGDIEKSLHRDKDNYYYARQMIKFPPKSQTRNRIK